MEEVAALRRACDDRALRAEEAEVQAATEKRAREDATVRAEAAEDEVRQLAAELGRLARREVEMDHQAARDADELERLRRQVVDAAAAAAAAQDEAASAVAAAQAEAVEARRERGAAAAQAATLTTTLAARDALVAQLESTAGERRAETDALRQRLGAAERQQQADAAAAEELRCLVETLSRRKAGHDHQVCRALTVISCCCRCVSSHRSATSDVDGSSFLLLCCARAYIVAPDGPRDDCAAACAAGGCTPAPGERWGGKWREGLSDLLRSSSDGCNGLRGHFVDAVLDVLLPYPTSPRVHLCIGGGGGSGHAAGATPARGTYTYTYTHTCASDALT